MSDVWRIIYRYSKTEAWRLRYCAGCAYLESAQGVQGNCGYLLQVGHSRGCRPGKGCKRKKLISGWKWKLRGTYEEYLNGPPPDGWTPHGIREREQMKAWRIHRWAGSDGGDGGRPVTAPTETRDGEMPRVVGPSAEFVPEG